LRAESEKRFAWLFKRIKWFLRFLSIICGVFFPRVCDAFAIFLFFEQQVSLDTFHLHALIKNARGLIVSVLSLRLAFLFVFVLTSTSVIAFAVELLLLAVIWKFKFLNSLVTKTLRETGAFIN
jgi:hypothetical protein